MRILVVEDEVEIRSFLKKSLEAEGLNVDVAENGEVALEMVNQKKYDLVTMDNSMPKKNGMETLIELRKSKDYIPVLMLSVKSETTTKVDLLNAGADDYLTKPFSLDELMARVRALLRRPSSIETEILQIDDLLLDITKHTVKRGENEIILSRKEFSLLEYFLKNIGVVLSRGMIMEHVWDMSADPFSNTIESHVLSLSKKIEISGRAKLLHTIADKGYKMEIGNKLNVL